MSNKQYIVEIKTFCAFSGSSRVYTSMPYKRFEGALEDFYAELRRIDADKNKDYVVEYATVKGA